jgi:hypothetical protein
MLSDSTVLTSARRAAERLALVMLHFAHSDLETASAARACAGVHLAPWRGPAGELVVLAIRADGRIASEAPILVGPGESLTDAVERAYAMLTPPAQAPPTTRRLHALA